MKKRLFASLVVLIFGFLGSKTPALARGYDFTFPAARRSVISGYDYSPSHPAYDYRFSRHTKVAAAKGGSVLDSHWAFYDGESWPCDSSERARGNFVILDHGNGLTTWYFHLSNTGYTPGNGTYIHQGRYMARADDTGCSDGDHLHFATKLNGAPFDPYAGATDWVGGDPIPMGYRDQNGAVHGPFALDRARIRNPVHPAREW